MTVNKPTPANMSAIAASFADVPEVPTDRGREMDAYSMKSRREVLTAIEAANTDD